MSDFSDVYEGAGRFDEIEVEEAYPDDRDDRGLVLDHHQFDVTIHDGMVTVQNPATGNHRTFCIATVKVGALIGKRIAYLMIGSSNNASLRDRDAWKGFAFVDEYGVHVWRKYRDTGSDFEKFARILENPRTYSGSRGLIYEVSARCRRCGRVLTHPESIATGLGPVCVTL